MRVDVAGHAFDVTPAIRRYCDLRVRDAVGHLETLVDVLAVRIVGPAGGASRAAVRCRMVAYVFDGAPVCAEETDSPHVAIDLAASSLAERLAPRGLRHAGALRHAPRATRLWRARPRAVGPGPRPSVNTDAARGPSHPAAPPSRPQVS